MNDFKTALKMFLFMLVLTGLIYPFFITILAQFTMPYQANGSLLHKDNQIIGSSLIAQKTTDIHYFWPRPSAIDYDPLKPSGGSNLGPISHILRDIIKSRQKIIGFQAPSELLYASGSGLDPHISLKAAYFQIPRIAKARNLSQEDLKAIVDSRAEGGFSALWGNYYINVLQLNQILAEKQ